MFISNFDFKTSFSSFLKCFYALAWRQIAMETIPNSDDAQHAKSRSPENKRCLNEESGQQLRSTVEVRNNIVESKQEYYILIVELRNVSNLLRLGNVEPDSRLWISYEFLGMVVQSDQFICSASKTYFPIKRNRFFWNGSCPSVIHMYVCAQERVLGVTNVQIKSVFFGDLGSNVQLGQIEINSKVTPIEPDKNELSPVLHQEPHLQLMIECIVFDDSNNFSSCPYHEAASKNIRSDPLLQILPKPIMEPLTCKVEEHIYEVAKQLSDAKLEIERKQKEWNAFVQREEKKFRNHLREKEEKVRNYLNLQIQQNQEEHSRTLELCRVEYRKLEVRLKKSLREVEAKEREMARQHEEKEAILSKKRNEFDTKEKMLREEAQHLIDMEVRVILLKSNFIYKSY